MASAASTATRFKPGKSGNPGGRPKNRGTIQELAREEAGRAIYALVAQLHDRRIAARERRAAARLLIRIGFGSTAADAVQAKLSWSGIQETLRKAAEEHAVRAGQIARARLISTTPR